jgi:acyl CoA:acetate/3-ketoacid CoA transferase beta subunit
MISESLDYTSDEIMTICMARLVTDGEIVAQGLATPLVASAYLLARRTHAPNLFFASAIGQGMCRLPAPLGLTNVESLWLDRALNTIGFVRTAADVLPFHTPTEFFRPGQVDAFGNFNNLAFGKDHSRPRLRLPGSGGIPDVSTMSARMLLYVPRHSRITFVETLDFCSGLGHSPARRYGAGPLWLVTDLGVFDFSGPDGRMRLVSFHPFSSPEAIQARTGFPLLHAPELAPTSPPLADELRLLRDEIDPLGIRKLEFLTGAARKSLLAEILAREAAALPVQ